MKDLNHETVERILEEQHGDRVFSVEDGVVWVSGMNASCPSVARRMAHTLLSQGFACGLVYDDGAVQHGGVQFNYGPHMCELCESRPSETLTSDSHPEGVNHLACTECAI